MVQCATDKFGFGEFYRQCPFCSLFSVLKTRLPVDDFTFEGKIHRRPSLQHPNGYLKLKVSNPSCQIIFSLPEEFRLSIPDREAATCASSPPKKQGAGIEKASNKRAFSDDELLARIKIILNKYLADPDFSVEKLGNELSMAHSTIYRKIINMTGLTPSHYIRDYRLCQAAHLLEWTSNTISEVAETVGFQSASYFAKCFKEKFNQTPSRYTPANKNKFTPGGSSADPVNKIRKNQASLKKIEKIIIENLAEPDFNVTDLSRKLNSSRTTLYRKIHHLTGLSPTQLIRTYRLKRALELLGSGFGNVTDVAFEVGFSSTAYFTRCFKQKYQRLPSVHLRQNESKWTESHRI